MKECIYRLESRGESTDVALAGYRGGESEGYAFCPVEECPVFSKTVLSSRRQPRFEWIPTVGQIPSHFTNVETKGECIEKVENSSESN